MLAIVSIEVFFKKRECKREDVWEKVRDYKRER